jgi:hypothetical protein
VSFEILTITVGNNQKSMVKCGSFPLFPHGVLFVPVSMVCCHIAYFPTIGKILHKSMGMFASLPNLCSHQFFDFSRLCTLFHYFTSFGCPTCCPISGYFVHFHPLVDFLSLCCLFLRPVMSLFIGWSSEAGELHILSSRWVGWITTAEQDDFANDNIQPERASLPRQARRIVLRGFCWGYDRKKMRESVNSICGLNHSEFWDRTLLEDETLQKTNLRLGHET